MIYIIHADNKTDFEQTIKKHNLNKKDCVFVLKGYESKNLKNDKKYQHIWSD